MVKLVLFDIDGTLIRTGGAGMRAFDRTFTEVFGLQEATRTLQFSGRTDVSLVRECFAQHDIEPSKHNFQRFFEAYPAYLEKLLGTLPSSICQGMEPFLADLFALPRRPIVGLLTGNIRRGAELKLKHFGLWEKFETGAFADDDEDRNCIAAMAKNRGETILGQKLAGEEIVVIGDTPLDIACAKSIGARSLAVATGSHKRDDLLRAGPTWAVEHIGQTAVIEVLAP